MVLYAFGFITIILTLWVVRTLSWRRLLAPRGARIVGGGAGIPMVAAGSVLFMHPVVLLYFYAIGPALVGATALLSAAILAPLYSRIAPGLLRGGLQLPCDTMLSVGDRDRVHIPTGDRVLDAHTLLSGPAIDLVSISPKTRDALTRFAQAGGIVRDGEMFMPFRGAFGTQASLDVLLHEMQALRDALCTQGTQKAAADCVVFDPDPAVRLQAARTMAEAPQSTVYVQQIAANSDLPFEDLDALASLLPTLPAPVTIAIARYLGTHGEARHQQALHTLRDQPHVGPIATQALLTMRARLGSAESGRVSVASYAAGALCEAHSTTGTWRRQDTNDRRAHRHQDERTATKASERQPG